MPFKVDGEVEIRNRLSVQNDLGGGVYGEVLRFENNVISSQITDGDIQIAPNGAGNVYLGSASNNDGTTITGSITNISITGNEIKFPSTDTSDLIISTNGTTSAVKINNMNISQGLITSNQTDGTIEIRPTGTGVLKLGANLSLNDNYTPSFDTLSGTYQALSIGAINGTNDGRHIVLNADLNGFVVMDQLGISNNILQNMNSSYDLVLRYSTSAGAATNDIIIDQNSVSILNSNGNPSFNLKTSPSDTLLNITNSSGIAKFDSSGFSFINDTTSYLDVSSTGVTVMKNGTSSYLDVSSDGLTVMKTDTLSYLDASSTGVAVMKNGPATEALDVSGNIAASGNNPKENVGILQPSPP